MKFTVEEDTSVSVKGRARLGIYGKVPIALLQEKGVTLNMLKAYSAIASFQGNKESCWPSVEAIAERAGLKPDKVSTATEKLARKGWLLKRRRGQGNTSLYSVLFPVEDFIPDLAESARSSEAQTLRKAQALDLAESAMTRPCGKRNIPTIVENNKGKEQREKSKETKAAPASAVAVEETPSPKRNAVIKTKTNGAPRWYEDYGEFWLWVTNDGLDELIYKRPRLYDDLKATGWTDRDGKPIGDMPAYLRGLNLKISGASDINKPQPAYDEETPF